MRKRPAPVAAEAPTPTLAPRAALELPPGQAFTDAARAVVSAIQQQVTESAALRRVVETLAQDRGRPSKLEATVERNGSGQMVRIVVTPKYGD